MKCSKAKNLISPYIDGELCGSDRVKLEEHIKVCESCLSMMKEMQGLHQVFVSTKKYEAPYGFHTRVMANVKTATPARYPRIPIPVRFAEGAVILLLIAVGIMSGSLLTRGHTPEKADYEIASLHLDVFDSAPPGTLGSAYLAMTEGRNEK
jgi:predicted anti-sigma-YlaC factor YlaD